MQNVIIQGFFWINMVTESDNIQRAQFFEDTDELTKALEDYHQVDIYK